MGTLIDWLLIVIILGLIAFIIWDLNDERKQREHDRRNATHK